MFSILQYSISFWSLDIHCNYWNRGMTRFAILGSTDIAVCLKSGYPKTTRWSSCSLLKLQGRNTKCSDTSKWISLIVYPHYIPIFPSEIPMLDGYCLIISISIIVGFKPPNKLRSTNAKEEAHASAGTEQLPSKVSEAPRLKFSWRGDGSKMMGQIFVVMFSTTLWLWLT